MYGKCQKCGKKLTDPESMNRGYGPECWSQLTGIPIRVGTKEGALEECNLPGQMTFEDFPEWVPEGKRGEKHEVSE